ncbi:MAG: ATP-binding cassette domain-containing protein [Oscillospiraceae bacterium]
MEYVLKTQNLQKEYRKFKALCGVTMNVPKGSIYGFVGKNGAGKTTLIRLICGLQFPTGGEYELYGVKNTDSAISQERRRMGAVVETPSIYLDMTAEDNLKQQYRILGMPSFDGIAELLKLVGLENTGKKKARIFSLGMRQRLGIAVALCGNPDFLVLDEPINGLDPQGIIEVRELIRNKLIVGCSRFEIFFANLITCVAAAGIFFIVWAVSGCVGIAYFGIENIAFGVCLSKLAVGLFTVISVTAILSVLAQLISSRSIGAIAAVFTALALLLAGSFFYNSLTEPQTTYSYVIITAENGVEFGDEVPNPAYVGGAMRTVYEIMLRVIPMGQQILLADEPLEQPAFMIACSVGVTVITAAAGYLLFRKKDLR